MAAATDKFKKLSRRWVGQIGAAGVSDASTTTVPLSSSTNLPTDTAVVAVIDRVDSSGTTTASLEETIIGVVSGNNLINCVRGSEGTAQAHNAGAVVEILVTAKGWNDLIDGFLVEHNQSGTHTNITACNITASGTITGSVTALKSATTSVNVSAATAPTSGQVLTATASTTATWQTPSTSLVNFASSGAQTDFQTSSASVVDVTGATVTINPTGTATVHAVISGRGYDTTTAGDLIHIQLVIDGTVVQEYDFKPAATLSGMPFSLSGQKSVSSGARIIKMRAFNGSGARQIDIDQANVSVIWS